MDKRPRLGSLQERLRLTRRGDHGPTPPARRRRVSRREREARRQRQLKWAMVVAGSLILAILLFGYTWENIITPRHVVATVDGTKIRRRDYWKVRSYDLINQARQYQQLAAFSQGQQASQYQLLAQQAVQQLDDTWGSTGVDDATLSRMIDDQVYLKSLDSLGLSVTDQDIDTYIAQQFEPVNAPILTPTPSPTLIPARAEWATQTAQAALPSTPVAGDATPVGSPVGSPAVAASPEGSPAASPRAATPEATPIESATPNQAEAMQTAEAGYDAFQDGTFDQAHLSEGDYRRLIVRPAVARQKVTQDLEADIGQSAEQVHAAHILVGTQDLATQIYEQVTTGGAEFEEIAKEQSTDTSTAPNGGDLGWFTKGTMVAPFEDAAFAMQPGEISEPVQSEFGWHIIKVYAHEQDRPMTDEQIARLKESTVQKWLDDRRQEFDISSEAEPTATSVSEQFVPPPDAPPPPTPTPEGTPAVTGSTPVASPVGSPAP